MTNIYLLISKKEKYFCFYTKTFPFCNIRTNKLKN